MDMLTIQMIGNSTVSVIPMQMSWMINWRLSGSGRSARLLAARLLRGLGVGVVVAAAVIVVLLVFAAGYSA
jgi:hypothetical protein